MIFFLAKEASPQQSKLPRIYKLHIQKRPKKWVVWLKIKARSAKIAVITRNVIYVFDSQNVSVCGTLWAVLCMHIYIHI